MSDKLILDNKISKAAQLIVKSEHVVVLTGAGISTHSGIPDFRSQNSGLWKKNDPLQVASLSTFKHHPERFYKWLLPLAQQIHDAEPNSAHKALAHLEQQGMIKAIITQNIDNLHQRSGSQEVLPVHGSLDLLFCLSCGEQYNIDQFWSAYIERSEFPHCKKCDELLKPNIVLMEEMLPMDVWDKSIQHIQSADLMFVIGSSLLVMPACELPKIALRNNAHSIIVNLSSTYLDEYADVIIHQDLNDIVPMIDEKVSLLMK